MSARWQVVRLPPLHFRGLIMRKSNRNCYLLIADGFAEKSVSQAVEFFLASNVDFSFLTLFLGRLNSKLSTEFDHEPTLIGNRNQLPLPDGLLFAGGTLCAQQFLNDPRVHQFVKQMHTVGNPVGFLYPATTPLVETFHYPHLQKPLLLQERLQTVDFLHTFVLQMPLSLTPKQRQISSLIS